jgi:anaerobic ribonucleoside-triphosphate reductase
MNMSSFLLPPSVIKRDGSQAPFVGAKIRMALEQAGRETGEFGHQEALRLAFHAVKMVASRYPDQPPESAQIRDVIARMLVYAGHAATARIYQGFGHRDTGLAS